MKAVAAAVGVVLGLALVAAAGYYLAPRLLPRPAGIAGPPGSADAAGPNAISAPHPGEALPTPVSADERLRQEMRQKRVPFFRYLRRDWASLVVQASVGQDLDTLDLVVNRDDDETLQVVVSRAVAPSAREYGFRRARFLVPTPAGSTDAYVVTAEATADADGHWTVYRK